VTDVQEAHLINTQEFEGKAREITAGCGGCRRANRSSM
jgi:hypothetical protein